MVAEIAKRSLVNLGPEYASVEDAAFVAKYRAQCHCGTVRYEVSEDPVDAKLCHCPQCQSLHGAPFQWAVVFHKHDVRFVRGVEKIFFYHAETKTDLEGDAHHQLAIESDAVWTHLRLNIFPDGGVSRFRIFGRMFAASRSIR